MIPPPPSIIHNTKHSRTQCFIFIFFSTPVSWQKSSRKGRTSSANYVPVFIRFLSKNTAFHGKHNYQISLYLKLPNHFTTLLAQRGFAPASWCWIPAYTASNMWEYHKKYHIFLTRWFLMNNNNKQIKTTEIRTRGEQTICFFHGAAICFAFQANCPYRSDAHTVCKLFLIPIQYVYACFVVRVR